MSNPTGPKAGLAAAVDACLKEQEQLQEQAASETEADLFGEVVEKRRPGRPEGARNKATEEQARVIMATGQSPLAFLASIYRDETKKLDDRKDAAKACLPYVHKKQPVAIEAKGGGVLFVFGDQLGEAVEGITDEDGMVLDLMPDAPEDEEETPTKSNTYEDGSGDV